MKRKRQDTKPSKARLSEAKKIANGGRRMPGMVVDATTSNAIDLLLRYGYADSIAGCVSRALASAALGVACAQEHQKTA